MEPKETVDVSDLIPIIDATKKYGKSRDFFDRRIESGELAKVTKPGDLRVYLIKSEVEAYLLPRVERKEVTKNG